MAISLYQFSSGKRQSDQMTLAVKDLTNEDSATSPPITRHCDVQGDA